MQIIMRIYELVWTISVCIAVIFAFETESWTDKCSYDQEKSHLHIRKKKQDFTRYWLDAENFDQIWKSWTETFMIVQIWSEFICFQIWSIYFAFKIWSKFICFQIWSIYFAFKIWSEFICFQIWSIYFAFKIWSEFICFQDLVKIYLLSNLGYVKYI